MSAQSIAAVPAKFYAYAVVDNRTTPPTPIVVKLTRREARQYVTMRDGDAIEQDAMRVRRVKCLMFAS